MTRPASLSGQGRVVPPSLEQTYLRLVLTMAASFQGGHSEIGDEVADLLCIPFPLTMKNLSRAAKEHGFDPDQLWPWLVKMRRRSAPAPECTP